MQCDDHDYIEIVCMYRYVIELTLTNGDKRQGQALDTKRNELHQECIHIKQADTDDLVVLDSIQEMQVLTKNPHITQVKFRD